jgi:hypothetical protein
MRRAPPSLLLLTLSCAALPALGQGSYVAADPSAPLVTHENLLASEHFWPYQVELKEAWQPEGRSKPLAAGTLAVLVRVEASGLARIDFGRDGRLEVPIARTDLIERANAIRTGKRAKIAPNFSHAIGPRLIDWRYEEVVAFDFVSTFHPRGYVAAFADPSAEGFAELVPLLAPLWDRSGVTPIFFPQGEHGDARVLARIQALEWRVPFVRNELSEGYTRALLPDGAALPALLLVTREGRLIFQGPWQASVLPDLIAAADEAFGGDVAAAGKPESAPAP